MTARMKLPEPTEKQVQSGITRTLRTLGYAVWDLSQPRAAMQTPGLPDLYVAGHGRTCWIEVKRPGGRLSRAQREFAETVRANGGEVHCWDTSLDAVLWHEGGAA